jgi:CheY-like chemotaxis protein
MQMDRKLALVIEDEPSNAALLAILLERCGVRAEVAGNGQEGLRKMEAHRPDLVLLDMIMPVMRGEEVLAAMRADPALSEVPVVVVSTMEPPAGDPAPGVTYIRKPYSPAEVKQVVRDLLGGAEGPARAPGA